MNKAQSLGPLERQVMDIVWAGTELTVRDVLNSLPDSSETAYTTVMTVMGRLVEKGFLVRVKVGKHYLYSQKLKRTEALSKMVSQTVDSFVSRFGEDAVMAFIEEADKLKKTDEA